MSTLQISLAVVGVVVLGLIVAYNAWNQRRNTPKRASSGDSAGRAEDSTVRFDPALDAVAEFSVAGSGDTAQVPTYLRSGQVEDAAVQAAPAWQQEPALDVGAAAPAAGTLPSVERKLALDGLIDAIATLRVEQPITGDAAVQVQPTTRRAGSKQFRIEGLNVATQVWETVRGGQRYSAFQAGVQLANRLGPLNEIEYSEFVVKVQNFGEALSAAVDLPDMQHEVARARELDQFASEHDAQLSFMLRPRRAAWSPGYLAQHAAAAGFVSSAMPGRMHLPSPVPGHAPLLQLSYDAQAAQADNLDQTAVHEAWISLDAPQVPRQEQPFARLREVVQVLCEGMDGVLCDQNGYQLLPQVLDPIEADLQKLYDRLDSRELSAGSMLARRLFN